MYSEENRVIANLFIIMEKIQNFVASVTGQEKVGFFDSGNPSFYGTI